MSKPNKRQPSGTARLLEITRILRKHRILAGLTPEKLRQIVEALGPTFVKLGQMMSMRPDILPRAYCDELQKLRTEVAPMPADEVRRVVEASLGRPLSEVFPTFDPVPLGSASIAQAHRATLPDGTRVVLKVQREGIYQKMASDLALLRKVARLVKLTPTGETVDFAMVIEEMWTVSKQELNFVHEADNAETFARLNQDVAYVTCPHVFREYSTRQVLVMEAVDGIPIDNQAALLTQGYSLSEIGLKLCANYLKQVLDDGFFQADPHPGNLLIRDGQIVWLDLGMMGTLTAKDRAAFQKALGAAATRDIGGVTEAVLAISKHSAPVQRDALYADVDAMLSQYLEIDIGTMNFSSIMQEVLDLAQRHHLALPPGVTLLGRGVSTLEGLIASISPDVNLMQIITQRFGQNAFHDFSLRQTVLTNARALYESAQKSLSTPALLNDALRSALKGDLRLHMDQQPSQAAQQAENQRATRLNRTLILSACILGASLTTLSTAQPLWFGLPWISVVGYGAAAVLAIAGWWRGRRKA